MKKLLSLFAGLFLVTTLSFAGNYQVNDEKIDGLFEQSTEQSILEVYNNDDISSIQTLNFASSPTSINAMDKGTLAFILLTVGWFTGIGGIIPLFGIHRIVMGSKGKIALIYCVTIAGIFGIVPLIDWIMLLINLIKGDGAGTFENNDKFFGFK
jgi:hypothetical protein